jgi:antitoxin MazE
MVTTIRKIGNSNGILIPKTMLVGFGNTVQIEVVGQDIVISPIETKPREGWAESFKEMAKNGDDSLLIPDVFEDESLNEWSW